MIFVPRTSAAALILLCLVPLAAGAQPPATEPSFSGTLDVQEAEIEVLVTDRAGQPVPDLTREDFQVLEDGKPQKIQTFGMVDIPVAQARKPSFFGRDDLPVEPDVAINRQALDGRLYLIVLDDYHVAPLRSQNVKNLARRFVLEKLGPDDQAAVVVTSGLLRASQDFTQNRRLLLDAIDNFVGQKLPSAGVLRNDIASRQQDNQGNPTDDAGNPVQIDQTNRGIDDPNSQERIYQARQSLNSLRSIAEWMSAIQGRRKAIILISEGVDFNLYDVFTADPAQFNFSNFNMVQQETWDTISAASRSNVQIYPVDPRGLTNMAQEDIEIGGLAAGPHTLELRNMVDAVYIDRFCLESSATTGQASSGPGPTSTSSSNVGAGQEALSQITVPAGTQSISVLAESTPAGLVRIVLVNPSGLSIATSDGSGGLVTLDAPVSANGLYVVKVLNLSLGPISVWTAVTPRVSR